MRQRYNLTWKPKIQVNLELTLMLAIPKQPYTQIVDVTHDMIAHQLFKSCVSKSLNFLSFNNDETRIEKQHNTNISVQSTLSLTGRGDSPNIANFEMNMNSTKPNDDIILFSNTFADIAIAFALELSIITAENVKVNATVEVGIISNAHRTGER
jgi:hypothetical protein